MKKALTAILILALGGCTKPPQQTVAIPTYQPTASIQDLMVAIIDPSADALWESVSSETTEKGLEEKQPRTDQEWQSVRNYAIALQESANLLRIPGRPVIHAGKQTEDAHVEGVSTPQQVTQSIATARGGFDAAAGRLHDAAAEAVAAIDNKDAARLLAVGARIDQACEHCHSVYWYPNAKGPNTAAWPAPLQAQKPVPTATP